MDDEAPPPFRGQATPAGNLDLLARLDEPEEWVREAIRISGRPRWAIVRRHLESAYHELVVSNQPPSHR